MHDENYSELIHVAADLACDRNMPVELRNAETNKMAALYEQIHNANCVLAARIRNVAARLSAQGAETPSINAIFLNLITGLARAHELAIRFEDKSGKLICVIDCGDVFHPAADSEEVTPENLVVLQDCIRDCGMHDLWLGELFVARIRGQRPMPSIMKLMAPELIPLFEACGQDRADA